MTPQAGVCDRAHGILCGFHVSQQGREEFLLPSPGNTERPRGAKLKASCCLTILQCHSRVMAMSCRGHPVGCFPLSPNRKMHLLPPFPSVHLEKPQHTHLHNHPHNLPPSKNSPEPKGGDFHFVSSTTYCPQSHRPSRSS